MRNLAGVDAEDATAEVAIAGLGELSARAWDWLTLPGGLRSRGSRRRHPAGRANVRRAALAERGQR